jgi:chromosome segregation ATPase
MLEQRISSSSSKKNSLATDMFTLKASTNKTQKSDIDELQKMYDDTIEELTALKREFSNATTTLAEQHIAIGKMESKLAENSENIEVLETEKAILNQKLALLQQIKSEYDIQTVQYEKMQQKLTEIETAMSVSMGSRSIGNEDGGQAHQQQLVSLKDTIAHMEHEMKLIRNENEKLSTQVKSRRDSNSYSTRIDQLETSLNVLLTQKEQMSKEIVQLRFVKEDYDEQVLITNDLESRLEELTRQIDVFKSQIEEKVDIIFQLESEMDQMEKDHDQHIKFLKEEQDRVLSEHEDHIAKLMDDIKFKENQLQFTEHQSQSPPLPPKDFSKSHDEISNLVSKLDAAEIELAELKIQMDPNANSRSINPISPEDDSFVNEHFLRLQHQKEMDKINEQVYNLESEIETLKLQLEKVTVESDSLKKKYETILRQNELLQNTVESKEAELKQLNDQLPQDDDFFSKKRHEEEMLQFQLRMEATLKELNSIESQINGFEEEKLAWSQKETEYTKLDSLYQQMLAEKEEQIEIFTYDLSLASERITKLQNQISSSDNAEDDVKSKSSDIITQLQNHCQELENQINDANQIIEDSDQQLEAYTHDLNQQQQVIDRMQIEIEKKTSRINDLLMNQNTVAKDSSSPKTPKLIALEQVVAEKEAHLHSIMEEMRILRQTNDEKGVRIQKLEEQLQERKFDIDRLKQELEKARNTQNSLKGGDTFKDSELKVKNEQLQELKSLVDELTLKVQKLAVENNETKIKLEKANALVEVLEQKKSELQLQAQELQNNNQELLEQVEYQAGIAEDALKQVDEYEDEILLLRKQNGTSAKISQVQAALERNSIGGQESDIRVEELELMNEQLMDKIASLSEKLAKQDANRISINPNMFLEQNQTEIDDLTAQLNEAISKIDLLQTEKFQLIDKIEDLQDHNHVLQQSLESK